MFQTRSIIKGVQLHLLPTQKFKTVTCRVYVQTVLEHDAALTALVPMVIARGSTSFPTMQAIAAHLAALYGARFDSDVTKIGERHLMEYYFEIANDTYLDEGLDLIH